MAKADPKRYAASLALYEKLVATNPKVERKGATMLYTSLNGHMFSLFTRDGWLALRLPSDVREAFLKMYKNKRCVHYRTVMKEYVEVPYALLLKTQALPNVFNHTDPHTHPLTPHPSTTTAAT